ncbi:P-loop NTPase [Salmonella enterica subsp. enterica]|nr:P-loop NTPase [Salmonella enterica subsp. enterica]
MTKSIAFLSGKGGVTKTSLARALAVAYINAGWVTGILDQDTGQNSFHKWNNRRKHFGHKPDIDVRGGTLNDARKMLDSNQFHLVLVDGAAYGSRDTVEAAKMVDMIVVSCRFSMDDMESAVETMNRLVLEGIPAEKFCVVFSGVPEQRSPVNYVNAQAWMKQTPYFICDGFIEQKNSLTDAQNEGLALNEVKFPSVRKKIDQVMENIATRFHELTGV